MLVLSVLASHQILTRFIEVLLNEQLHIFTTYGTFEH